MNDFKKYVEGWIQDGDFPFEKVMKIGREYFLVSPELKEQMKLITLDPFSAGVFLGEQKKDFLPSLALLNLISKFTEDKIYVNAKSAWLFACGRDLFEDSVLKGSTKKRVLVLNEKNELLGYAVKAKDGKKTIYKNKLDIGYYLRREKSR